jgi:O-antigen/teichoic acid export membrane protein
MSNSSTFRPALLLMSGRAAAFAVTFLIPVVLSRIFSQADFGTYKQVFLIVYTLYGIGQIGMAECLFYFIPGSPKEAGRLVANSVFVLGITGLLCFLGLVAVSERMATWLSNPELSRYVWMAGAYLFLMLLGCALETVMVARKRYRWATFTYAGSDLLRGVLFIIPAFVTGSVEWLMIGGLLFCTLRAVTLMTYLRSEFREGLQFDPALLKRQFAYTMPFALSVLVEVIQANYHQYAVSWHFDAATFAIYSVGCLQIPLVDFMASPACNVMMVRMGEEVRDGRPNHVLPIWHDTSRKLALVFFPLVALIVVTAPRLIPFLFTDAYKASVPIFMVWSLSILFAVFQTDGVLRVFAQTRFLFLMNLSRLAVIAALMTWSLNNLHLIGAVLVTMVGILVAKTMALMRIRSLLKAPIRHLMPWLSLGGIAIVSMLAAIPAAFISSRLTLASIYVLPIAGMAFVAAYAAQLLAFGLLSEGEKRGVWDLIARYTLVLARRPGIGGSSGS